MLRTVGKTIRELRKLKNLTQEELAEAINVTPQAISKWENGNGLPDIQQLIPLATFFNVSTDTILGIAENNKNDEIQKIIDACMDGSLKKDDIKSWLILQDSLKKYPSNLRLLQVSIEYGNMLSYKENYCYNEEYADKIYKETIKQADLIIKYSNNVTNIMRAHMIMVLLHSSFGDVENAVKHANELPTRNDLTTHAMCAYINHMYKEYDTEQINLQRDFDSLMFSTINTLTRLGISYENTTNYNEALKIYFSIFDYINYIFKDDDYIPAFYRTEYGNLYAFVARTYLNMGNIDECLNYLEKLVNEEIYQEKVNTTEIVVKNKFLDKANWTNYINYKQLNKECDAIFCLTLECFNPIKDNERYKKLLNIVKNKKN